MNDGQTLRFDDQYEPVFSYLNKKIIGIENSTLREHNILLDHFYTTCERRSNY